jgi:hypothetical protein
VLRVPRTPVDDSGGVQDASGPAAPSAAPLSEDERLALLDALKVRAALSRGALVPVRVCACVFARVCVCVHCVLAPPSDV